MRKTGCNVADLNMEGPWGQEGEQPLVAASNPQLILSK